MLIELKPGIIRGYIGAWYRGPDMLAIIFHIPSDGF